MTCKTIDEVIEALEKIIQLAIQQHDPKGFFAVLYYKVTVRVKEGIRNKEFAANEAMEILDVLFANRYLQAYASYQHNGTCTASWKVAFDACKQNRSIALQHILAGINAHINLDLGIAANDSAGELALETMQQNFYQINAVLSTMIDDVKTDIGRMAPAFRWIMPLAKKWDEKLMQFSIVTARDGAWLFAKQLRESTDKELVIQQRDQVIYQLGYALHNPGRPLSMLLSTIRSFEFKPIGKQIALLWNQSA